MLTDKKPPEKPANNHNNNYNNNNNNNKSAPQRDAIDKDQLALIKSNLLSPNEVTFCDISDDNSEGTPRGRKRRLTSTDTDTDSIVSSVYPTQKKKPEIPDGGFGWVVVGASVMVSLIADGVSFSFGLIYTELLSYFGESKSKTAWIGSLFLAVPLMSGPIMSNLVDKYGCRKMTILGGFMAGLGFVLASMCNSIETLYLTFGLISGLGLGIGYVTAVVSIAFWFDKKRAFATGIGASGTGIGTFLYAPFTQWLIDTYGWRGTSLILAGTLFNMCVCGCLMRDPEWLIEENRLESRSQSVTTFSNSSVCLDEIKKLLETGAAKEDVLDTLVTNFNTEANQQIGVPEKMAVAKKFQSELLLPTYFESQNEFSEGNRYSSRRSLRKKDQEETLKIGFLNGEKKSDEQNIDGHIASIETLPASEKLSESNDIVHNDQNDIDEGYLTYKKTKRWPNDKMNTSTMSLDDSLITRPSASATNIDSDARKSFRGTSLEAVHENEIFNPDSITDNKNKSEDIVIAVPKLSNKSSINKNRSPPKKRNHAFDINPGPHRIMSNYFQNMRVHRNSIHYRGAMLNTHRYRLRASSCPNIYRNSMTTLAREDEEKWYDNFVDIIKSIFDFSQFKDVKFLLINLSTLFLFIWFIIPYFYITEHLKKYDYNEEDCAVLISIIGFFNTIGMIFLGWVGDKRWLNVTKTYAFCLVVCGFSVCMMPVAKGNYAALISLCILFGFTFASSFSFTPIILVRLVDLDDFTCAYGLVLLVQGIGNLVGPPIAGFIYELTLRWDDSFYAAGFFIAVSGALAYATSIIEDRDENDENYSNE